MYKLPDKVWSFVYFFAKKQYITIAVLMLSSLVIPLSNSIWPYISGILVDKLNASTEAQSALNSGLYYTIVEMFLFWILIEALHRIKGYSMAYIVPRLEADIRLSVFKYVNQHSYSYFIQNYVGGIANRIADLPRAASTILDEVATVFFPLFISIILSSTLFFNMDTLLALVLFTWLTVHIFLAWLFSYKAARYSKIQSEARTQVQGKIVDSIANHLNVKLFTAYRREEAELADLQKNQEYKQRFSLLYIEKIKLILGAWGILSVGVLFYITIYLWQQADISTGDVVFVLTSTLNLIHLIAYASDEIAYLYKEIGICDQGLKIVQDPLNMAEHDDMHELEVKNGTIAFHNVSFRYKHNDNIFHNQNLIIPGGKKTGLVGFSGSGKTTFAHLIMRLYDISSGNITIDGQDINSVALESLRRNIALIPQDPILFHRTVMENIRYGRASASDEEVISAAKRAFCHDFIMNMEGGYRFQVGERGGNMSGGQRQRIAIARAILKDAPIIIMDEATSALDAYTEAKMQESLDYLVQVRTVIVIAHKLATLRSMDKILVFDHGSVIEEGTHEELLEKKGHYWKLWTLQQEGSLPH